MKKTLSTILALFTALAACWAQNYQGNGPQLGLRGEWNLNSPQTSLNDIVSIYHNGSGFAVGAFYSIPIYKGLQFEPGLSIFYNTVIIAPDDIQAFILDYKVPPQGSLRNWGLRIPFNFGYKFPLTSDMALAVFTGPQLNVGLSLKQYINADKSTNDLYGNGWHRLDAQWAFGVRFYYSDNWMAEITGGVGLSNLLSGNLAHGNHFRRNTFAVGIGYIF